MLQYPTIMNSVQDLIERHSMGKIKSSTTAKKTQIQLLKNAEAAPNYLEGKIKV